MCVVVLLSVSVYMQYGYAQRYMRRSCKLKGKPRRLASLLITVAGSCFGSPTTNSLEGPCWNAMYSSGSVAAAASSTMRASTWLVIFNIAVQAALHSVEKMTWAEFKI